MFASVCFSHRKSLRRVDILRGQSAGFVNTIFGSTQGTCTQCTGTPLLQLSSQNNVKWQMHSEEIVIFVPTYNGSA